MGDIVARPPAPSPALDGHDMPRQAATSAMNAIAEESAVTKINQHPDKDKLPSSLDGHCCRDLADQAAADVTSAAQNSCSHNRSYVRLHRTYFQRPTVCTFRAGCRRDVVGTSGSCET